MRVALVGPRGAEPPEAMADHRLSAVGAALQDVGLDPQLVLYDDDHLEESRERLLGMDGALVWVNPEEGGRTRARLNQLLREVASSGFMVSAHPDTIDKMGTKEVVFHTRGLGWGSDIRLYRSWSELSTGLPKALDDGPRVLKRARGNGGHGVWKVERQSSGGDPALVWVQHAARGSRPEQISVDTLLERFRGYFDEAGTVVDQAYQQRLTDGMIRCYLVGERVAGFGEQLVNALYPAPPGTPPESAPQPGPRLYYPADRDDLQPLRRRLEQEWVPAMCATMAVDRDELPVIWDADFLYGSPDGSGHPGYVLCEINVSSVFPFPDSALAPLATETVRRLAAGRPSDTNEI